MTPLDTTQMAHQLLEIYACNRTGGEKAIETHLNKALNGLSPEQQEQLFQDLISVFEAPLPDEDDTLSINDEVMNRIFSLLLGKKLDENQSSEQLLEKLAGSLNTVFDSLNKLISVINTTLTGGQQADETIRQVIGYHIEGGQSAQTLENHIGRISEAFLIIQEAFKKASMVKVGQILEEFSPRQIEQDAGVMKLNPMRKAKCYETFEIKYAKFREWYESGRFMESYLREFERNCQNISLHD